MHKKIVTPHQKKDTRLSKTTNLPVGWLIGGIVLIASIGLWRNGELNRLPTPAPSLAPSEWQKISDMRAIFTTEIFLDRNKTFVYVPIKFENTVEPMWLNYDSSSSAQPNELLMTHPALTNLNWNRLSIGTIHLYQKQNTYKTFDDFLNNPPEKERLVIDNGLNLLKRYSDIESTLLTDQFDISTVDFILTTYIPIKQKNNIYFYENTIDASEAIITNNAISWMVFAPNASITNPYYLGNIHIDYNRKVNQKK